MSATALKQHIASRSSKGCNNFDIRPGLILFERIQVIPVLIKKHNLTLVWRQVKQIASFNLQGVYC
ncbi:hypothetical protein AEST_17850 [Alishewanella aestuarii B11]|uniref:Uncharacterized protein n=1 Tax=Alishewanella aestuarii B11 TaxID=1197174 RepID=J1QIT3_9ALTE|nr:hypothetical protein AEST_17850 [Alishewanella aestuarii B11]OCW98268.1 hypothetical protein A9165_02055 [Alishewanella sp. HH-ZS]